MEQRPGSLIGVVPRGGAYAAGGKDYPTLPRALRASPAGHGATITWRRTTEPQPADLPPPHRHVVVVAVDGHWVVLYDELVRLRLKQDWHDVAAGLDDQEVERLRLARLVAAGHDREVPVGEVLLALELAGVPIPPGSTLTHGRVRRAEGGGWLAEAGWGSTLQALGTCGTVEDAEDLVRQELTRRRYAFILGLPDRYHSLLAPTLPRWPVPAIDVHATTGDRIRAAATHQPAPGEPRSPA